MSEDRQHPASTLALNTKVEEDFVSPLTAVRGALEILRDHPDLAPAERRQFVETALRGCARLEHGVKHLAQAVYDAGARAARPEDDGDADAPGFEGRISFLEDGQTVEISLEDLRFSSPAVVNAFYDVVDRMIEETGRKWYFVVNYQDCSIWPEAWVAFAHRAKKVHATYSHGTVRYAATGGSESQDPDYLRSREDALTRIGEMKAAATPH